MNVEVVKGVYKDCNSWRSVVSAYPHGQAADIHNEFMYDISFCGAYVTLVVIFVFCIIVIADSVSFYLKLLLISMT